MDTQFRNEYLSAKRALFDKYYDFLNNEQRRAVFKVKGPLLILAGAGSGKTTVLVNRLSYLIKYGDAYNSDYVPENAGPHTVEQMKLALALPKEKLGAYLSMFRAAPPAPWRVMAITFTNKAAGEIKERIKSAFGEGAPTGGDVWAGTFHSVCMRFLRRWAEVLGYSRDFGICDSDDAKKLVTECMKDLKIDTKQFPVKGVINAISGEKDKLITPEEAREEAGGDAYFKVVASVYALYQKRLKAANLMDFDDIIMQTVRLFEENRDILDEVQSRFEYICVDEYQDTNRAQFTLTKLIAGKYKNIMAVGDDDQSIYKFRGATIQNILDFDSVYPEAEVIKLEQNYRSTSTILDAANAVIKNNRQRKGKNLWTAGETGEAISVSRVGTQNDEARFIAEHIQALAASKDASYRDIAVLYRTNVQSRSLEQTFAKSGIPYRMLGSLRFFDRQEIKDILAYIAVVNNPQDNVRLKRIINVPRRGIGAKSIEAAEVIAYSENVPLLEIMSRADRYTAIPASASKNMKALAELFDELIKDKETSGVAALIEKTATATGYLGMLIRAGEEEKDRIENIGELISTAKQYEESNEEATLSGFLEDVALVSDVDRYDESADAVILMTIHSAKGLEFPVVFLPGMEEGLFPGYQSIMNPEEIEEERRLAYVALTRAKKKIYITCTFNRMINGSTQYNPPSRFIDEIPSNLCDSDMEQRRNSFTSTGAYGRSGQGYNGSRPRSYTFGDSAQSGVSRGTARSGGTSSAFTARGANDKRESFAPGDKIRHSTFGAGVIVSAKPMGGDTLYEINFEKVGTKKLMATYARLTKAE